MLQSIKYILFDFSDDFKKDYLNTLTKSILFLILGIVLMMIGSKANNENLEAIGSFSILIFGLFWGVNLYRRFIDFKNLSQNFVIKVFIFGFVLFVSICFGYIYSVWGLIKLVIWFIIKQTKNKKN